MLTDELSAKDSKIERLLSSIDELQQDDSRHELAARRAERDLREEKEERMRLERELEGWKGLRVDRGALGSGSVGGGLGGADGSGRASSFAGANGSLRGSPSIRFASGTKGAGSRSGSGSGSASGRGSSLAWSAKSEGIKRQLSNSKVYL